MDYGNEYESERSEGFFRSLFRPFVCVVLSLLFGLQVYAYFWTPQDVLEGDFSDVKYVVMQLTRGLTEVNRKHEKLQDEMERISETLPAVAAAASRAKAALEPVCRDSGQALAAHDYDRQGKVILKGRGLAIACGNQMVCNYEIARHTICSHHQVVDYALATAGGRVIDTGDTVEHIVYESPVSWMLHALSSTFCRGCIGASKIIRPGYMPGECWAFKGTKGEATIRLIGKVRVTGVSLEHIPSYLSPIGDIPSAPRLFRLEGFETRRDPYPHDFGTFEYDKNGSPNQYFEVMYPLTKGCNLVRITIYSNWGHPVYTCVYRVRVHGELLPADDQSEDGIITENE